MPSPSDLARIGQRLEAEIDAKDKLREQAMVRCRGILRSSTGAVRAIHQGEDPTEAIAGAVREAGEVAKLLQGHPEVSGAGFVEEALQELAEAGVVHAILVDKPLPTPEDLHCPPIPYLLGLGDAVGELRRAALDAMRTRQWARAEALLGWMDALFDLLIRIDQPVAAQVRRKQDVARGLIEKTRGELTVAMRGKTLEEGITGILDELEKGKKGAKKRAPPKDLDLDAESEFGKGRR
ncbi:MAG TPA: translin family protein [Candidatus Thermoplasmatota archaeon]|nr:translin family protein [Candidatus Thermoplasmatota archaeon]